MNIDITSALAKGEKLRSADALRQNLGAAELASVTVEKESKERDRMEMELFHLKIKFKDLRSEKFVA